MVAIIFTVIIFVFMLFIFMFVFIFVNAFLAAGLSAALVGFSAAAIVWLQDVYPAGQLSEYLSFAPLLMFPEAFVNGLVITLLVAYKPAWVKSFEDEVYLTGK